MSRIHFFAAALTLLSASALAAPLNDKQGDAILEELRQIRVLLERQAARPVAANAPPAVAAEANVQSAVRGAPALGRPDAPLTLVIYTDYECPFCRRFETQTLPELRKKYIDTGKLRFVVLDLPLDMHANARRAAEAARCAGEQDRYWDFRERLTGATQPLDAAFISSLAKSIGIDDALLNDCVAKGRFAKAVADSSAEASRQGIAGTPTFVIGKERNGVVEGARLVGAQPFAVFEKKIDELLGKQ